MLDVFVALDPEGQGPDRVTGVFGFGAVAGGFTAAEMAGRKPAGKQVFGNGEATEKFDTGQVSYRPPEVPKRLAGSLAASCHTPAVAYNGTVRLGLVPLMVGMALLGGPSAEHLSFKRKLELIRNEKVPSGSRLSMSAQELNAYVRGEVPNYAPQGVREPQVELGNGSASGFAYIDFPKLRQGQGKPLNWFLGKLLAGERPVRVDARIRSGSGRARVDVERIEISGVALRGPALDFLIENFLLVYFPDAKVGRPFELAHRIERLVVQPAGVWVVIGR